MANPQHNYGSYPNVPNVPQISGPTTTPHTSETMRQLQLLRQQQAAQAQMVQRTYAGGPRQTQMPMPMPGTMPMARADIQSNSRSTLADSTSWAAAQTVAQARTKAEIKAKATDELVQQVVAGIVPFIKALDNRTEARLNKTDRLIELFSSALAESRSHSENWQKSMTEALSKTHVMYSSNIKSVAKKLDGLEKAVGLGSCEGSDTTIMSQVKEVKCMLGDFLERIKDPEAHLIESTHQVLDSSSLQPNTPLPLPRIIHHEMGTSPMRLSPAPSPSVHHEMGTNTVQSAHIDASIGTTPKALPLLQDVGTTPLDLAYNISISAQSPELMASPSHSSMSIEEQSHGVIHIASNRRHSSDCVTLVDELNVLGLQNKPDDSAGVQKADSILLTPEIHGDDPIIVDDTTWSISPPSPLPDDLSPSDWAHEAPQAVTTFFQPEDSPKVIQQIAPLQDQILEEDTVTSMGDDVFGNSFTGPLTSTPPRLTTPSHSCASVSPSPPPVLLRFGSPEMSSMPEDVPNPTSPIIEYSSVSLSQMGTLEINQKCQLLEKNDSIRSPIFTSTSPIQDRDSISIFQSSVSECNPSLALEEIEDDSCPDKVDEVKSLEEDELLTTVSSNHEHIASPKHNTDPQSPLPPKPEAVINVAESENIEQPSPLSSNDEVMLDVPESEGIDQLPPLTSKAEAISDVPESEGIDQLPPLTTKPEAVTTIADSEDKELVTALEESIVESQGGATNFSESAFEYSQSLPTTNTQNREVDDSPEMAQLSMCTFEQAQPRSSPPRDSSHVDDSPQQDVTESQVGIGQSSSNAESSFSVSPSVQDLHTSSPSAVSQPYVDCSPQQDVTESQVGIGQSSGNASSSCSVSPPVQDLRASSPSVVSQPHSLAHPSNEGIASNQLSDAEIDTRPATPTPVVITSPTPVSEDKRLMPHKTSFSTQDILQVPLIDHLQTSPAASNMSDEEVVSNLILRQSSPLRGNAPPEQPLSVPETGHELNTKDVSLPSVTTPTATPAQIPGPLILFPSLVPKVVPPSSKQIPAVGTTSQATNQSLRDGPLKSQPRDSITPVIRPPPSRPLLPAKSPSITLQSNLLPSKRADLVLKSPLKTQLLSKEKVPMKTNTPIYVSSSPSSPVNSKPKITRAQSPISMSSGTVASTSAVSTTRSLSSMSDLSDEDYRPRRPPSRLRHTPVYTDSTNGEASLPPPPRPRPDPFDSDGETDIIPAKKAKRVPIPAEVWEGTPGKERKKGLLNLNLLSKTGKSAAITKIKKRMRRSGDSDEYGSEPPLKRARLRLAMGQEVRKANKEREIKKEKLIGEDGKTLGWSLNKGKEKERQKLATKPESVSPRKSRKPKEAKVRWPKKMPPSPDGFHKSFLKCDMCATWYHCGCVGIRLGDIRLKSTEIFSCPPCEVGDTSTRPQVSQSGSAICGRSDCDYRQPPADVYFVSAIVGRKSKVEGGLGRSYQWLVKWDGYPITQATWEGEDSMTDPQKLIEEFEEAASREGINIDEDPWGNILLSEAIKGGWQSESELESE